MSIFHFGLVQEDIYECWSSVIQNIQAWWNKLKLKYFTESL